MRNSNVKSWLVFAAVAGLCHAGQAQAQTITARLRTNAPRWIPNAHTAGPWDPTQKKAVSLAEWNADRRRFRENLVLGDRNWILAPGNHDLASGCQRLNRIITTIQGPTVTGGISPVHDGSQPCSVNHARDPRAPSVYRRRSFNYLWLSPSHRFRLVGLPLQVAGLRVQLTNRHGQPIFSGTIDSQGRTAFPNQVRLGQTSAGTEVKIIPPFQGASDHGSVSDYYWNVPEGTHSLEGPYTLRILFDSPADGVRVCNRANTTYFVELPMAYWGTRTSVDANGVEQFTITSDAFISMAKDAVDRDDPYEDYDSYEDEDFLGEVFGRSEVRVLQRTLAAVRALRAMNSDALPKVPFRAVYAAYSSDLLERTSDLDPAGQSVRLNYATTSQVAIARKVVDLALTRLHPKVNGRHAVPRGFPLWQSFHSYKSYSLNGEWVKEFFVGNTTYRYDPNTRPTMTLITRSKYSTWNANVIHMDDLALCEGLARSLAGLVCQTLGVRDDRRTNPLVAQRELHAFDQFYFFRNSHSHWTTPSTTNYSAYVSQRFGKGLRVAAGRSPNNVAAALFDLCDAQVEAPGRTVHGSSVYGSAFYRYGPANAERAHRLSWYRNSSGSWVPAAYLDTSWTRYAYKWIKDEFSDANVNASALIDAFRGVLRSQASGYSFQDLFDRLPIPSAKLSQAKAACRMNGITLP